MTYGLEDVGKLRQLLETSAAPEGQKRIERQKLDALLGYCETTRCRRQVLLEYFGETLAEPCGNCDTCLEPAAGFDGTEAARKALSCVYRTGQIFGAQHVIDVLLGGDTEKVRKFRHNALSTYGIGSEFSRAEWRSIFRQLVSLGLLAVDIEGHGGLRLGAEARPVLRGERRIELRRDAVRTRPAAAKGRAAVLFDDPKDEALFQALRARRLALAKAQGVPPYVIFHDSTLAAMARQRPRRPEQLAGISGVGQAKLERYGEDFLAVIVGHEVG
jgi:ATP-dependent DNA helicase RecQ